MGFASLLEMVGNGSFAFGKVLLELFWVADDVRTMNCKSACSSAADEMHEMSMAYRLRVFHDLLLLLASDKFVLLGR